MAIVGARHRIRGGFEKCGTREVGTRLHYARTPVTPQVRPLGEPQRATVARVMAWRLYEARPTTRHLAAGRAAAKTAPLTSSNNNIGIERRA